MEPDDAQELARQLQQVEAALDAAAYESTDEDAVARLTERRDDLVGKIRNSTGSSGVGTGSSP